MANKSSIKLLGSWASPFTLRTRIAMNLKSAEYEFVQENLVAKSKLLLTSNPVLKKVPVLLHGQRIVCESLIIVQYIDELWSSGGPVIIPSDPYERSVARFWAAYIDDKWFPSLLEISMAKGKKAKNAALEQVTDGILLLENVFEKSSKGKAPFFGGELIGYIDIALGGLLGWVRVTESVHGVKIFDEAKTPCLVKWADVFCADAAVKDIMPDTPSLVEYANAYFARQNAAAN